MRCQGQNSVIPFCYFSALRSAYVSFHHIRIPLALFFFILRLMKILWKSSVFYLSPSYTLDTHTIAKSCNIFQQIPIFLRLLHLNNASLFSTTNRSKILIIKSMSDIDYCHSNYCHKKQAPMTASFSEGFYFSLKTLEEACCIL